MFSRRVPTINLSFLSILLLCPTTGVLFGQTNEIPARNNPYSTNPSLRTQAKAAGDQTNLVPPDIVAIRDAPAVDTEAIENSAALLAGDDLSLKPTTIYKIGIGDVLIVNLKNTTNAAGDYMVREDGTIDLPLVAKPLLIAGQTPEEAAKTIAAGITLYSDARVEVRVREFRSHRIKVIGLVEISGPYSLKREALPLYVIRADVRVHPSATSIIVRRNNSDLIATLDLRAPDTENLLIYPGDSIEFTADRKTPGLVNSRFYNIAGAVNSVGQKQFTDGMTLFQAILASGGMKGSPKKANVRRKTETGTFNLAEYNLRSIKEGKLADPQLSPGDMIEIGN